MKDFATAYKSDVSRDGFMREAECESVSGLSRTTRWRLERAGKFPARRKIGESAVGWRRADIMKWVEACAVK